MHPFPNYNIPAPGNAPFCFNPPIAHQRQRSLPNIASSLCYQPLDDYLRHCSASFSTDNIQQRYARFTNKLVRWTGTLEGIQGNQIIMHFATHNANEDIGECNIYYDIFGFQSYGNTLQQGTDVSVKIRIIYTNFNFVMKLENNNIPEFPDYSLTYPIFYNLIFEDRLQSPSKYFEMMFNKHQIIMTGYLSECQSVQDPSFGAIVTFEPKPSSWMKAKGYGGKWFPQEQIKLLVSKEQSELMNDTQKAAYMNEQMKQQIMQRTYIRNLEDQMKFDFQMKTMGFLCEVRAVFLDRNSTANPAGINIHYLQIFGVTDLTLHNAIQNLQRIVHTQIPYRTYAQAQQAQTFTQRHQLTQPQPVKQPNIKAKPKSSIFGNLAIVRETETTRVKIMQRVPVGAGAGAGAQIGPGGRGQNQYRMTYSPDQGTEEFALQMRFVCPISSLLMKDPVIASDQNSYERQCIEDVLRRPNPKSPMNNQPLTAVLNPDYTKKLNIEQYIRQFPNHPLIPD